MGRPARRDGRILALLLPDVQMPWRVVALAAELGVGVGAIVGFFLGLAHLPTLPFAIVEGGFLIGVPMTTLGLVFAGLWSVASAIRSRMR